MMETCQSILRCLENIPIVGHLLAACYACSGERSRAERAGLKATAGFLMAPVNIVAEIVDEATRKRPEKLEPVLTNPRPNWMKRHRTNTLQNICLPGTHLSSSYKMASKLSRLPTVEDWCRCQHLNITEQLMEGIRFLDVRVMTHEGDIWTHADLITCMKLRDVLEKVRDFVLAHPTEIVGVHITNDKQPIDWAKCHVIIQELLRDRLIPEFMRDKPIGDILDQRKYIFICGMPVEYPYSWQQIQYRYPNKAWPHEMHEHLTDTIQEIGLYRPSCLFWYKAECTPVSAMYARSAGGLPGLIATRYGGQEKYESMEELASVSNSYILQVLDEISRLPFNIISFDYAHDDVIDRIVKLNEFADSGIHLSKHDVSSGEEGDDVFLNTSTVGVKLINNMSTSMPHNNSGSKHNSSTLNSSAVGTMNTSFDFRLKPAPAVQVKESTF